MFTVSLRWCKETSQFSTIALSDILCASVTLLVLLAQNDTLVMPLQNVCLSTLHGYVVGFGLILFSMGPKFLSAAQLVLFSMTEVVCGILWMYLPVFGIHEIPSLLTVVGGIVVLSAIIFDGVSAQQQQ